eukprot:7353806-Pyramimonas_sp.AAC.1
MEFIEDCRMPADSDREMAGARADSEAGREVLGPLDWNAHNGLTVQIEQTPSIFPAPMGTCTSWH